MSTNSNVEWIVLDPDELPADASAFRQHFGSHIVGQPNAERVALAAYERAQNPLRDMTKPIGIYVLIGPSRTGKTETGKVLAKFIHQDETAVTVVEASDFIERHLMTSLTGSSNTYVGYLSPQEVAKLDKRSVDPTSIVSGHNMRRVRLDSQSKIDVVIINEFEKGCEDFYKFWMGAWDNGFVIHKNGVKTDFSNTIFIVTMNLGMEQLKDLEKPPIGFRHDQSVKIKVTEADVQKVVDTELKKKYKKEFLNRITAFVVYRPLGRDDMLRISELEVGKIKERIETQISARQAFTLDVQESAREFLVDRTIEEDGDVAELKRQVESLVADKLGRLLAGKKIGGGDYVAVARGDDGTMLVFHVRARANASQPAVVMTTESAKQYSEALRAAKRNLARDLAVREYYNITIMVDDEDQLSNVVSAVRKDLSEHFEVPSVSLFINEVEPFLVTVKVHTSAEMIELMRQRFVYAHITKPEQSDLRQAS